MTNEVVPNDTSTALKHYFSVYVGGLRITMRLGSLTPEIANGAREKLTSGLASVIQKLKDGKIPAVEGIGESQLQEMLDVVSNGDLTQPATIINIYDTYSRITGEKYDEKLFEGLR